MSIRMEYDKGYGIKYLTWNKCEKLKGLLTRPFNIDLFGHLKKRKLCQTNKFKPHFKIISSLTVFGLNRIHNRQYTNLPSRDAGE